MDRNLAPIFDETAVNWRSMHAGARDMIRTFVSGPKEAPDAAVTAMRAWEACWLLQHFVDASDEHGPQIACVGSGRGRVGRHGRDR